MHVIHVRIGAKQHTKKVFACVVLTYKDIFCIYIHISVSNYKHIMLYLIRTTVCQYLHTCNTESLFNCLYMCLCTQVGAPIAATDDDDADMKELQEKMAKAQKKKKD